MENPELKPCPKCLDPDWVEIHRDPTGVYKPEIVCTNCGISLQDDTVEAAAANWNDRPAVKA